MCEQFCEMRKMIGIRCVVLHGRFVGADKCVVSDGYSLVTVMSFTTTTFVCAKNGLGVLIWISSSPSGRHY